MLRDFQLIGWRGMGRREVIELEEKRKEAESMGRQSVLVQKETGPTIYHRQRTADVEWRLKVLQWSAGIFLFYFFFYEKLHSFATEY